MIAITTKYLPATNHEEARVEVDDGCGHSIIIHWDSSYDDNEKLAVKRLCEKMDLHGTLQPGALYIAGIVYKTVWTFVDKKYQIKV